MGLNFLAKQNKIENSPENEFRFNVRQNYLLPKRRHEQRPHRKVRE